MTTTSIPRSAVYVNDAAYRFNYGHAPRGRGSWAFTFGTPYGEPVFVKDAIGCMSMTYAAARRIAVDTAAARGIDIVFVCT